MVAEDVTITEEVLADLVAEEALDQEEKEVLLRDAKDLVAADLEAIEIQLQEKADSEVRLQERKVFQTELQEGKALTGLQDDLKALATAQDQEGQEKTNFF